MVGGLGGRLLFEAEDVDLHILGAQVGLAVHGDEHAPGRRNLLVGDRRVDDTLGHAVVL